MSDLTQVYDALKAAHAAGDTASATKLAQYIASQQTQAPQPSMYEREAKAGTGFDNLLPAVGGAATSAYLGGKQMLMQGLDAMNPRKGVSRADAMIPDIEENRAAMAGLTSTKMGMAGDIVGNTLLTVPAMFNPVTATMKGAAALGGVLGALRPTLGNESRIENVGTGAAFGAGGQWLGNKIAKSLVGNRGTTATGGTASATSNGGSSSASSTVSGGATVTGSGGGFNFGSVGDDVSAGLNDTQRALMKRAQGMGYQMTPGQASGSRALQQFEAKLESQPMTSGRFNAIKSNNQTITNRVAANSIGEVADVVDSGVLAKAHDRISNVYKIVADDTPRTIDSNSFISRLGSIEDEFEGLLPGSVLDDPLIKRLYAHAANGEATGKQLQDIASKLGRKATNEMTSGNGDRQLGMALSQAKDLADDLLQQGLNGKTAALFGDARSQYRNMILLTQRNGVINSSNGNVSAASLANLLQQKDKGGFMRGGNTSYLYDAARFGQGFKPIAGDSGTATRSALPSPTDFVLSLPFNIATKAYTSSPVINLSAKAGDISRNGLLGNLDPEKVKHLAKIGAYGGAIGGGLLALP